MDRVGRMTVECAIRAEYARALLRLIGRDPEGPLAMAFATVPRENFVGSPPWRVRGGSFGTGAETEDIADIYSDVLVSLDREKTINNGSPSLHARALDKLSPAPGEKVVHIGAGTGYYSAIIAELVGSAGHVTAVECCDKLAARARAALKDYPNVDVIEADGALYPLEDADIVYVNFACDHPADAWVERLKPGGRLLFPLGIPVSVPGRQSRFSDMAAFLLVRREADGEFSAHFLTGVSFIWGEGPLWQSQKRQGNLRLCFRARGLSTVKGLRWKSAAVGPEWYGEEHWGLTTAAPSGGHQVR